MHKNRVEDMIKIKIINKDMAHKPSTGMSKKNLPPYEPEMSKGKGAGSRFFLWFALCLAVFFFFLSFSYMFADVEITINPKVQAISINQNLSAAKESNSALLSFDVVVISGEETRKVEAREKKALEIPARGTVIFYNAFSTSLQTLNIDTRLEGSNGKLYKTEKRVILPGMSNGTPGKIEVGIYAAEAGEIYNSTPLDFKIFGFRSTPKYEKMYARSKGDITGGVKGEFYTLTTSDKERMVSELRDALEDKLLRQATEQTPKGFILFKNAVFLDVQDKNVSAYSKDMNVSINIKGTLHGVLFNEKKLTEIIAKQYVKDYDGSDVFIPNMKNLSFILNDTQNTNLNMATNISFVLKGETKLAWRFNEEKFKSELLNKKKRDFNFILSKYKNVESANLSLDPAWRMSMPDKLKNIKVMVNYPK